MNKDLQVVILGACRTPIGSFGGALKDVARQPTSALSSFVKAITRAGVTNEDVGDVVLGCVLQAGAGMNVARQAALKAGLPNEVPGETTVNCICGSGLQAVVHAVEAIRVGYVDTMVAGGTESMSTAPYLLKGARWGYRMGNAEAMSTRWSAIGLTCAITFSCPWGSPPRKWRAVSTSPGRIRMRSLQRASAVPPPRFRPAHSGTRLSRFRVRSGKAIR